MTTPPKTRRVWPKGTYMKPKAAILHAMIEDSSHSYADVGRYAGCHRSLVGALAKGTRNCRPDLAECIAQLLGVRVEFLFEPRQSTSTSRPATGKKN